MDPILAEVYSTILPSMPYVIGAYVLIWLLLFVYVLIITINYVKLGKQIAVLEEELLHKEEPARLGC